MAIVFSVMGNNQFLKTLEYHKLSPAEKDSYISHEFGYVSPYTLTNISTNLSVVFQLALAFKLGLSIYQTQQGDVWTGIGTNSLNDINWGKIDPAEAGCLALLKHRGIEACVKILL